ncbi:hypothetical protein [Cerasicoccus fimbriatus]|uniref:hypothetical protein n=1 Tax=Cerasicoccus fimbriatus TaxID=3014554 RepID=UPI0022B481E9|nr:hypothetical protein [Cerasicoccus sp. TK19100]
MNRKNVHRCFFSLPRLHIGILHIGMAASKNLPAPQRIRRKADEMDSPRDKTVCFMLSKEEKAAVDTLGICTRLTRSALLAKITTIYLNATNESRSLEEQRASENQLLEFIEETRLAVQKTPAWQKQITTKTNNSK